MLLLLALSIKAYFLPLSHAYQPNEVENFYSMHLELDFFNESSFNEMIYAK